MIVRELVTILGFQVEDEKLQKYEKGMRKVRAAISWASVGVVALGTVFLKTAGDMEQTRMAFDTILGSTQKANKLLGDIAQFAAKTPFERTELIGYAKSMVGVGWAAEEIIPTMRMLGDIAAGVGKEKLPNIVLAFNKMKAKGRASLEELWPIVEAGVPVLDQLQEDLGMTKDDIIKMATDGKLGFEQVQKALDKVAKTKFADLMNKQSKSFLGVVSNILDYLTILASDIGEELLPMVKDLASAFLDFVESNKEVIKGGIVAFFKGLMYAIGYCVVIIEEIINRLGGMDQIMKIVGGTLGFVWGLISGMAKVLWKLRYVILAIIATMVIYNTVLKVQSMIEYIRYLLWFTKATRIAAVAQALLNGTMLATPIFWVIAGIVALITIGYLLIKNWDKVRAFFIWLWKQIVNAFTAAWKWIWGLLDNKWIQGLLATFLPFIGIPIMIIKNWKGIAKFFTDLWTGIVGVFNWAVERIRGVWDWLTSAFDKIAQFLGLKPKDKKSGGKQGKPSKGPKYAKGTDFVPEDQWAYVHRGEKIIPAGRGGSGGGNVTYQITSNPTIVVPEGTPRTQAEYLKKTAKQVVHEEWQSILRQVKGANPAPQGV